MIATLKLSGFVLLVFITISCNLETHKNFTAYKNIPIDSNSSSIRINGVYFLKNYTNQSYAPTPIIFLYRDGSAYVCRCNGLSSNKSDPDFWNNPEEYMSGLRVNAFSESGHYWVRGEDFYLQTFSVDPGAIFSTNTIEHQGFIKNDSTIVLTKSICSWCYPSNPEFDNNGVADLGQIEYRFYRTTVKADSSKMWFKNRRWYMKYVWNSR